MNQNISPPPLALTTEKNRLNYKTRFTTDKKTLSKIKETGYDPQEALEFFPQIIKESSDNKRKYEELSIKIEYALETSTKTSAARNITEMMNKRLRGAIMHLHPSDYWEIIRKAEKGYYELLRNQYKED